MLIRLIKKQGYSSLQEFIKDFLRSAKEVITDEMLDKIINDLFAKNFYFRIKNHEKRLLCVHKTAEALKYLITSPDTPFFRILLYAATQLHKHPLQMVVIEDPYKLDENDPGAISRYLENQMGFLASLFFKGEATRQIHHEMTHNGNAAVHISILNNERQCQILHAMQIFAFKNFLPGSAGEKPEIDTYDDLDKMKPVVKNVMGGFDRFRCAFNDYMNSTITSSKCLQKLEKSLIASYEPRASSWADYFVDCDKNNCKLNYEKLRTSGTFFPPVTNDELLMLSGVKFTKITTLKRRDLTKLQPNIGNDKLKAIFTRLLNTRWFLSHYYKVFEGHNIPEEYIPFYFLHEIEVHLSTELPFDVLVEMFPEMMAYKALFHNSTVHYAKTGEKKWPEFVVGENTEVMDNSGVDIDTTWYVTDEDYKLKIDINTSGKITSIAEKKIVDAQMSTKDLLKYGGKHAAKFVKNNAWRWSGDITHAATITLLDDYLKYRGITKIPRKIITRGINFLLMLYRSSNWLVSITSELANIILLHFGVPENKIGMVSCGLMVLANCIFVDDPAQWLELIAMVGSSLVVGQLGYGVAKLISHGCGFLTEKPEQNQEKSNLSKQSAKKKYFCGIM